MFKSLKERISAQAPWGGTLLMACLSGSSSGYAVRKEKGVGRLGDAGMLLAGKSGSLWGLSEPLYPHP